MLDDLIKKIGESTEWVRGFISSLFSAQFFGILRSDRQGQCQTQSFLVFAMRGCVCLCARYAQLLSHQSKFIRCAFKMKLCKFIRYERIHLSATHYSVKQFVQIACL